MLKTSISRRFFQYSGPLQKPKQVRKRKEPATGNPSAPKRPRKPKVAKQKSPGMQGKAMEDDDETEDEDELAALGILDAKDMDLAVGMKTFNGLHNRYQQQKGCSDDDSGDDNTDDETEDESEDEETKAEKRYFEMTINASTRSQPVDKGFDLEATLKEAEAMLDEEDTEDEVEDWGILNV